jgi:hypothetical protein
MEGFLRVLAATDRGDNSLCLQTHPVVDVLQPVTQHAEVSVGIIHRLNGA